MTVKMRALGASHTGGTATHVEDHVLVVTPCKNSLQTIQSKTKYFAFDTFVQSYQNPA